ncbi:MAG TPA: PIN domain-containing protein [Acidobacteriaceae bacterium]|nr:PIN domain-containing protein [Acidobacteriaceae bacterium]
MIVLVDTCVWSLALRRSRKNMNINEGRILDTLKELIFEGRIRMLGQVRQELLSGIRHKEQFDFILNASRNFPDVPVGIEDYEAAAVACNTCRSAGISGSPADFLLCAVAQSRKWAILTTDKDFKRYQKHLPLVLLP